MITELKSVRSIWKKMPSEYHGRVFLEEMISPTGRYCPHCGSVRFVGLRCQSARAGLYQCSEQRQGDDRQSVEHIVEDDEAFVGGAPTFKKGVKNKRGRDTKKPVVHVAADRNGQAKATLVPNAQGATLGPIMKGCMDPHSISMTDGNRAYRKIGKTFAAHHTVNHDGRQHSRPSLGAHINTVEAVNSQVQRALVGVCHRLGRQNLQGYLNPHSPSNLLISMS